MVNDVSYNQVTRYGYLPNGRRNQVVCTAGNVTLQNVTDAYDENERSTLVTDSRGAKFQLLFDNLGNYRYIV